MILYKMDDNPGLSLFQNSHFDIIKSNTPAPEEIEAEQDQIRYQKELEQILEDEFEDLGEMNTSMNSSYSVSTNGYLRNSSEKKLRKSTNHSVLRDGFPDNCCYKSKDYSNSEQLEVLYNVRLREIEKLRDEKKYCEEQFSREKTELSSTIEQLRSEKENILVSHKEIQKLLVETTSRLTNAERELANFQQKWSESEQIKSNALHELELNKITIKELEKRLLAAEKNSYINKEKNFDNLLKELTLKNKKDISELHKEINNLNNKIVTKEIDYAKLEQQLIDTQRTHETVLNEKTKIIDKLNANLSECYVQYQSLLSDRKSSNSGQLLSEWQQKSTENETLKREITNLKEQVAHLENISKNEFMKLNVLEKNRKRSLSPINHSEIVKLKNELQYTTDNVKMKQNEIDALKEKLFTLSKDVELSKNAETGYSNEIETLKAEKEGLLAELKKSLNEQNLLKIGLMDYATKTDVLHQEQIAELELASSKKLLELDGRMKEMEFRIKDDALKIFTEEVDQITVMYSNHFDKLNVAVEQLKTELEGKNSLITQMNAKVEKFRQETEKVYNKYRNSRKIAVTLKQIIEDRTQLLRRHQKQYVQTLNEIQKYLDNALVSKTIETDKLTELIEKSTKNTINVDELLGNDEMNAMLLDINKKLMWSE